MARWPPLGCDSTGFFSQSQPSLVIFLVNRVTFIVDGFNLYHSVRDAEYNLQKSTKWLNIFELCRSYLPGIAGVVNEKTTLQKVYYFSALAIHMEPSDPDVTIRHKKFIECLKDTKIEVHIGRFKQKEIKCSLCSGKFIKHEEKETDVAIAIKLFEEFHNNSCDTAVLVTGDTDLSPVISTAKKLFHSKTILFLFPAYRKNKELAQLAPGSFTIKPKHYVKYQFADPYHLSGGKTISKPISW